LVGIGVGLLDASVFDDDLAIERRGDAEDDRAPDRIDFRTSLGLEKANRSVLSRRASPWRKAEVGSGTVT